MERCSFCSEINYWEENNLFDAIIRPATGLKTRIIYETQNWVLAPTLGCFIGGYVLVISKKHFSSIALCPSNIYSELEDLIFSIKSFYKKEYKSSSIIFEHGGISKSERGGCCVEHAHLHIVPLNIDVVGDIKNKFAICESVDSYEDVKKIVEIYNKAYLFYENIYGKKYVLFNDFIPSQYFRQIICNKLGLNKRWDWRSYFFLGNIKKTFLDMRNKITLDKK